jgi:hypothetical protein
MDEQDLWSVQLWLGEHLIEEHSAPAELAEQYANVIRLRIHGLPNQRLVCRPVGSNQAADRSSTTHELRE